jgi:hypothetical protein
MPLYYFQCAGICKKSFRRILRPDQATAEIKCPTNACTGILKRTPKPPTSNVVETLDNGWMTKRVERLADVERLISDRARKASKESSDD